MTFKQISDPEDFKQYYFLDFLPYNFENQFTEKITNKEQFQKLQARIESHMPKIYQSQLGFFETLGDDALIQIILCFGAGVIQHFRLDRFLFFVGPSNTGKSTAICFFDKLFIESAVITKALSDLGSQFGLMELAETNPRILVVRNSEGAVSNKTVSTIKRLVSNAEPFTIQRKFKDSVNVVFYGGLIIASNFQNLFSKNSKGILEKRIIPIEFSNVIIPEKQKYFPDLFPDS
uniref:SF3 helicase domain-containing protein n=1 Tax=Pseudochlorodesmis sp. HV01306c TaxID=2358490 RepID=A0A386AYH3_9CHLO|nr:hypothetical protein [Pseudochlorodesmis sp. HV01306c]